MTSVNEDYTMTKLFNQIPQRIVPERTLADVQREGEGRLLAICDKCGKSWNYAVSGLIENHGDRMAIPAILRLMRLKCPSRGTSRLEPCEIRFR
jgi:hypothetical protein